MICDICTFYNNQKQTRIWKQPKYPQKCRKINCHMNNRIFYMSDYSLLTAVTSTCY